MDTINVLAFDLGASSGRGMLARFDGTKITLEEVHRFPHNFSVLNGRAYWNIVSLYEEMKEGMRLCKEPLSVLSFMCMLYAAILQQSSFFHKSARYPLAFRRYCKNSRSGNGLE